PVTFGWGPRFLHSTGQYHKGGPAHGVFLQVTADPERDMDVPGREFSFGSFIDAQAAGDGDVLRAQGRPVLRLHLHDTQRGLAYLGGVLAWAPSRCATHVIVAYLKLPGRAASC